MAVAFTGIVPGVRLQLPKADGIYVVDTDEIELGADLIDLDGRIRDLEGFEVRGQFNKVRLSGTLYDKSQEPKPAFEPITEEAGYLASPQSSLFIALLGDPDPVASISFGPWGATGKLGVSWPDSMGSASATFFTDSTEFVLGKEIPLFWIGATSKDSWSITTEQVVADPAEAFEQFDFGIVVSVRFD
ncbi:MAG: hypothetical protein LBR21_02535 [Propionibacteriaceae bacterium]|nr:hypothetical protein [Propionibacteriaceae bacterium]